MFLDFGGTGPVVGCGYEMYQKRRSVLVQEIRGAGKDFQGKFNSENEGVSTVGRSLILLFANFERDNKDFEQDSSFFYYTGIDKESACVVAIEFDSKSSKSTLFVPNCVKKRKLYLGHAIEPSENESKILCFDKVEFLGSKEAPDLYLYNEFEKEEYNNLLNLIETVVKDGGMIFTADPKNNGSIYVDQRIVLKRVKDFLLNINKENFVDISGIISKMRRKKDIYEVTKITDALGVTAFAHEEMAKNIAPGVPERQIQAIGESVFTLCGGKKAYQTVVANGANAITLHYFNNSNAINNMDLVLIDSGANLDGYCSDITRTYPANGSFTTEQLEFYSLVLATQKYIASIVKPGFYLSNKKNKSQCLTSLAREFMTKHGNFNGKGYGEYMTHGIGHHIGLDIHDIMDIMYEPLQEGDVITIEPGIYIPEKKIGIRIEDNYWVTKDSVVCLSDMIPKEPKEICEFMKNGLPEKDFDESLNFSEAELVKEFRKIKKS